MLRINKVIQNPLQAVISACPCSSVATGHSPPTMDSTEWTVLVPFRIQLSVSILFSPSVHLLH